MELPEGFTVPMDEDDEYMIELCSARTTAKKHNIFEVTKLNNGNIQIICSSTKNSVFAGTEGEVLTITLEANSTLPSGVYEMELVDVRMTDTNAVVDHVGNVKSEITGIKDILLNNGVTVLYNLNGQRVNKYAKGIIISNGKKILK